jgi:hypothetical protein
MLEDIAILTGGAMVSADLGIKLENVTVNMLGRAKKVMIDKENTTIVSGAGKKADIHGRIAQIKTQIEETTSDYDREKLQERLTELAGGVAVLRVGGVTEIEVKERKDRVDDATVPRLRKVSCRAEAWRCYAPARRSRRSAPITTTRRPASRYPQADLLARAPDRHQCRRGRLDCGRQDPEGGHLRPRL